VLEAKKRAADFEENLLAGADGRVGGKTVSTTSPKPGRIWENWGEHQTVREKL
jgi:hypothetical protein